MRVQLFTCLALTQRPAVQSLPGGLGMHLAVVPFPRRLATHPPAAPNKRGRARGDWARTQHTLPPPRHVFSPPDLLSPLSLSAPRSSTQVHHPVPSASRISPCTAANPHRPPPHRTHLRPTPLASPQIHTRTARGHFPPRFRVPSSPRRPQSLFHFR